MEASGMDCSSDMVPEYYRMLVSFPLSPEDYETIIVVHSPGYRSDDHEPQTPTEKAVVV